LCVKNQSKSIKKSEYGKIKTEIDKFDLNLKLTSKNYIKLSKIYTAFDTCLDDILKQVCDDFIENKLGSLESIL